MQLKHLAPAIAIAAIAAASVLAAPIEEPGFKTIFNGKDLTGWDGNPDHWSVVEDFIRGDSTVNRAKGNTFIIWRDGTLKNFELKLKYRIHTGNNSGVQYRSKEVGKWVVSGYQAEVQNQLGKTGFLYHEKGRGWLVDVGDMMEISADGKKAVVGVVADRNTITKTTPYHVDKDWNEYHFICRGNHVTHHLGGYQTVELIDYHVDKKNEKSTRQRCMEGVLALQVHGGSPMTVDFKDIRIKQLSEPFGEAKRLFNGKDVSDWTFSSDAAKAAWTVCPLDVDTGTKRRTKSAGPLNVLQCAGGAEGVAQPGGVDAKNYVLRFQKRVSKDTKGAADAPIKPVLGWETIEAHVQGGQVTVTIGGAPRTGVAAPIQDGKIAFPCSEKAEYRNIVLIPIGE